MFCYQCEQAAKGTGCAKIGVCGKEPQVSDLQDLLIHAVQGLCQVRVAARKAGIADIDTDRFIRKAIFSTLTNVDFDATRIESLIREAVSRREELKGKVAAAGGPSSWEGPATFEPAADSAGLQEQAAGVGQPESADPDIRSLKHIVLYRHQRRGRVRRSCRYSRARR